MRFILSYHAVDRYVARIDPRLTTAEARRRIMELAQTAVPLRARSLGGQDQWAIDEPPCVLVTRKGRYESDRGAYVVVTILTKEEAAEQRRREPPIMVPAAIRFLIGATAGELHDSLTRLLEITAPLDLVPARVLLQGFELLCQTATPNRNVVVMRDNLRTLLADDQAPVHIIEVEALWRRVIELAKERAPYGHTAWWATVRAWESGLSTIRRAT